MEINYSQNGEQYLISEYFGDFNGILLSIGENDGKTLSNVYTAIIRGWKGTLVEPSEEAFDKLSALHEINSEVTCFNFAVSNRSGVVKFHESGTHLKQGDTSLLSTLVASEKLRWKDTDNHFTETEVLSVRFDELIKLSPYKTFDLISIDAEGVDIEILRQIDLDKIGCKMLIIEWNSNPNDKQVIVDYCKYYGMELRNQNAENLIFVK